MAALPPADEELSLPALLESLLFVADGPVPAGRLAEVLEITPAEVMTLLEELSAEYAHRGLRLQWSGRKMVQLTTAPTAAQAVERFLGLQSTVRLSPAAMETLAMIAYRQPITRPRVDLIRGVNSDGVIRTLLSRGLVEQIGRQETVGRPVLYGTTPAFLQHFGLGSLQELPVLEKESSDGD
jgi:segregation and condensation protein B